MSSKKLMRATATEVGERAPEIRTGEVSISGYNLEVKVGVSGMIRQIVDADFEVTSLEVKLDRNRCAVTDKNELIELRSIPIGLFVGSKLHKDSDVGLISRYGKAVSRRYRNNAAKKFLYRQDGNLNVSVQFTVNDRGQVDVLAASLPQESKEYMRERMRKEAEFDAAEEKRVKEQQAINKAARKEQEAKSQIARKEQEQQLQIARIRARREADQQKKLEREAAKVREERRKELVRIAREKAQGKR